MNIETTDETACPICRESCTRLFIVRGYPIHQCARCTHRFVGTAVGEAHVDQTYDDSYFNAGGAGYTDYLATKPAVIEQGKYYGKLLAAYTSAGALLDIGAAAGFVMEGMRQYGWMPEGVEPNRTMAQHARSEFGLHVHIGTLESFPQARAFDAISLIQVLGHFVDPSLAISRVVGLVRAGGFILTETWNHRSLWARACGRRWHEYSPPSVLQYFSKKSLEALMRRHGCELVASGQRHKTIQAQHAHSLAKHVYGERSLVVRTLGLAPSRMPIPYLPDDLFWAVWRRAA